MLVAERVCCAHVEVVSGLVVGGSGGVQGGLSCGGGAFVVTVSVMCLLLLILVIMCIVIINSHCNVIDVIWLCLCL